jgi:hypothetical protein
VHDESQPTPAALFTFRLAKPSHPCLPARIYTEERKVMTMSLYRSAGIAALWMMLAGPAFSQSNATPDKPTPAQETNQTKKDLKQQQKADKAQAKADKSERKALGTKQQRKADKDQTKANKAAETAPVPPS